MRREYLSHNNGTSHYFRRDTAPGFWGVVLAVVMALGSGPTMAQGTAAAAPAPAPAPAAAPAAPSSAAAAPSSSTAAAPAAPSSGTASNGSQGSSSAAAAQSSGSASSNSASGSSTPSSSSSTQPSGSGASSTAASTSSTAASGSSTAAGGQTSGGQAASGDAAAKAKTKAEAKTETKAETKAKAGSTAKGEEQDASKGVLKNQEKPPENNSAQQQLGISLISNKFVFQITQSYIHNSSNQLFINGFGLIPILVVGNVSVERIRRDTFMTTMELRYKVNRDSQVQVQVPYQYSITRQSTPAGIVGNSNVSPTQDKMGYAGGFGDISVGMNYSLMNEGLNHPALLGGLIFKGRNGRDVFTTPDAALHPPPGSGFFSVGGSLTASKTTAPAIVYGSIGYNHAFPRNNVVLYRANGPPVLVNFEPGDSFNVSAGMTISLNYSFALNFSYAQTVDFSSYLNGRQLGNSAVDAIMMRIGATWRLGVKSSIDVGATFGLTPDAPNFRLDVRIPWNIGAREHHDD